MRTPRLIVALGAAAAVLAPSAALAAPPAPAVKPIGPLAAGARSDVGGALLARTGTVRLPSPGVPALPAVSATSFLVADLDSGQVLAARDAHGKYSPASTLKTLTAVALMPEVPATQLVRPAPADVNVEGSKVGLVRSMSYPATQLFTALLTVSGNDAAGALATAVGGMPKAAALMNAEAQRLHALDTKAVNTSGLDAPGQTSSAYDLALIARAGMADPAFRAYVGTRRSKISAPGGKTIEIYNHNKLLGRYDGALGIKNGYTSKARTTFVGAAQRNGRTIVITMMRANSRPHIEAGMLLDWGFKAAAAGAQPIGELVAADPKPVVTVASPEEVQLRDVGTSAASAAAASGLEDEEGLPVVPALMLVIGAAGGMVLVKKHREQTDRERRALAARR